MNSNPGLDLKSEIRVGWNRFDNFYSPHDTLSGLRQVALSSPVNYSDNLSSATLFQEFSSLSVILRLSKAHKSLPPVQTP